MEALLYSFLAGTSTVFGALLLFFFGQPGKKVLATLLGFAGAMIYIVNDELIPQANGMHSHLANAGLIAGLLLAFGLL